MTNHCQDEYIRRVIKALVVVLPFLVILHAHLVNGALFLLALISIYTTLRNDLSPFWALKDRFPYLMPGLLTFYISPIVCVFLGQLFRFDFSWPNYDSPSRILICLPVFIVVYCLRIDTVKYFVYSMPAALFIAVLLTHFSPFVVGNGGRITTRFVDLLTFGSLCLTFGVLSFVALGSFHKFLSRSGIIALAGLLMGLYLSVESGSRTGWLALPVVLIFWSFFYFRKKYITLFAGGIIIGAIVVASCLFIPKVKYRITQAAQDVRSYKWNGSNEETSISERISFYRIGFSLFAQRPFSGWGDRSFAKIIKEQDKYNFASQATREGVIRCGFHNEIMTNAIRSGVWGILSSLILFSVPGAIFVRAFLSKEDSICKYGFYGLSYLLCIFVSSLSTEIFNLKYTASFHALMLSILMGATLSQMAKQNKTCAS